MARWSTKQITPKPLLNSTSALMSWCSRKSEKVQKLLYRKSQIKIHNYLAGFGEAIAIVIRIS